MILIVEDDPICADLYKNVLEANGYETLHLMEGWLAMKMVPKNPPDLIVMDIQLPDISGLKVTGMLKEIDRFKDIPIIAVTAFPLEWSEKKCREAGCDDYIAKPISVQEFLEKVTRFVP